MSVGTKTKTETLPILLIEDESTVVAFVRAALERNGYRVEIANSAAQGLRLLETGSYRGVISDMRTPGGMGGAGVLGWRKENQPAMSGKLLFMTGDIAKGETAAILEGGGARCSESPCRVLELVAHVGNLFSADLLG